MIYIGSDHGGFLLKKEIIEFFNENKINFEDMGCFNLNSVDYPDIAINVCNSVLKNNNNFGILCCGTGIGMSICANKIKGIRAACCSDYLSSKYTRLHNNANILCLGGRVLGAELAKELVNVFISTKFENTDRHNKRLDKISKIEK